MTNPTVLLKVPEGSYKKANQLKLLPEYLFYLRLKTVNIQGFIKKGRIVKTIQTQVSLSESNIRQKISKLNKLGWIKYSKEGISISNYDCIWNTLGIVKSRGDGLCIFKINPKYNLKDQIYYQEIKRNLKKQQHYSDCKDTDIKPRIIRVRKKLKESQSFDSLIYCKNILNRVTLSGVMHEVNLSCGKVSDLLGYSSDMQGSLIEKRLRDSDLIEVINRKVYLGECKLDKLPKGFLNQKGKLFIQLCNKIIIKPINFFNNTSPSVKFS